MTGLALSSIVVLSTVAIQIANISSWKQILVLKLATLKVGTHDKLHLIVIERTIELNGNLENQNLSESDLDATPPSGANPNSPNDRSRRGSVLTRVTIHSASDGGEGY